MKPTEAARIATGTETIASINATPEGRSFPWRVNQKEPSSALCKIDDGQLCSPILSLMCSIKIYKRSDVHPYLIGI